MFRAHRCQICGETYLGTRKPDRCPFCGAAREHLRTPGEWVRHGKIEVCEQSRKDIERAIDLEINNQTFYRCSAKATNNQIMEAFFKRLASQEGEHAELLCEMIGVEEPAMPEVTCSDDDSENMKEAHFRENRAIHFYLDVANRAPEPRVQEVFRALADIESEHLIISSIYR